MAITGPEGGLAVTSGLGEVRRFEAAGFRAWPAGSVHYDGAWAVRMTAGHPAKRLNSINPLDPADVSRIPERIARVTRRFEAYGRTPLFRITPLAPRELGAHLDQEGWSRFGESIVMRMDLSAGTIDQAMDLIPVRDPARFLDGALAVHGDGGQLRAGLSETIDAIEGETGLFLAETDGAPVASAICVSEYELAGLFEVATLERERGRGHGRAIVLSALKWARLKGARTGWLQVEAENAAATGLYQALGFSEVYRYHYRSPNEEA